MMLCEPQYKTNKNFIANKNKIIMVLHQITEAMIFIRATCWIESILLRIQSLYKTDASHKITVIVVRRRVILIVPHKAFIVPALNSVFCSSNFAATRGNMMLDSIITASTTSTIRFVLSVMFILLTPTYFPRSLREEKL